MIRIIAVSVALLALAPVAMGAEDRIPSFSAS